MVYDYSSIEIRVGGVLIDMQPRARGLWRSLSRWWLLRGFAGV